MSKSKWPLLAVLVWVVAAAVGTACYGGQAGPDLSALAQRASPAVGVLVTFDVAGEPLAQGTAFFVRADGVSLTCHHVLSDAASALVRMENGDFFPVEGTLAADPVRDLALFKVAGKDLPTVPLGDSSTLAPGQRVVAITAPEGLENTIADGLVSAVRELPSGPLVQVTVPLSPGSSGGPIFDLSGRVVAVAAVILTEGQALNFAIPINAAKRLLDRQGKLSPLVSSKKPAETSLTQKHWLRERPASPVEARAHDLWLQGKDDYWLEGHYQEAVGHLRAALRLDPSLHEAYCCLGQCYSMLERRQDAVDALKQAIRLKPTCALAHSELGMAYKMMERYQEAIAEYKQAIRLKPDYEMPYFLLGHIYRELRRDREAKDAFKQAVRMDPDNATAHSLLGDAYLSLGLNSEAIAEYKEAIRLKPDYLPGDAYAYVSLGICYASLGSYEEAIAAYKEAVRLKPDNGLAQTGLAFVYERLGRWQEAIGPYKEVIRIWPSDPLARPGLGWAYIQLGRYQEAIAVSREHLRLWPGAPRAHYLLGLSYLHQGDRSAALEQHRILQNLHAGLARELSGLLYP